MVLKNRAGQGFGLNQEQAALIELGVNISPAVLPALTRTAGTQLKQFGIFGRQLAQDTEIATQQLKTYVGLRNGNIFAAKPTLFHSKTSLAATENIFRGIPTSLNPNNRFGAAFYTAQNRYTTINELAHHGAKARYAIRYQLNESQVKMLDLTQRSIAKKWGYPGGNDYTVSQAIANKAREAGYNVIRFTSERGRGRGAGANLAVLDDFNTVLTPQEIVTVPDKQPGFSNAWHKLK